MTYRAKPTRILLANILALFVAWGMFVPLAHSNERILVIGDSMLAWHTATGRSVPDVLARELGEPVKNMTVSGSRMGGLLPTISTQFRNHPWEFVVMNGGANDIWMDCGCRRCETVLDKLITVDGTGKIPDLIKRVQETGAQVIYTGYLRSPGVFSIFDHCADEGDLLEARVADFAAKTKGVFYMQVSDLIPHGSRAMHAPDMIHPSVKGSRKIGQRLAQVLRDLRGEPVAARPNDLGRVATTADHSVTVQSTDQGFRRITFGTE